MFKKVKLKDVDVLTLYQGKMTNGRRSSPIPQLQVIYKNMALRTSEDKDGTQMYFFFSVVAEVQAVLHLFLMWCSVITEEVTV